MLVLLKVNGGEKLAAPQTVDRDDLQVGQTAIAVGRTFDGDQPNLSVGVISATNRIWGKAIQTDAKISPINYGGPLVDLNGRVMGILVPMSPQGEGEIAGAEWYDSGIGFAVPLAEIMPHLDTMKGGEDLHAGLLGVSIKAANPFADPVVIAAVPAKSPAKAAGLKVGDKIIECNGKPVERQAQLKHALGAHYAGDRVKVVVLRGEDRIEAEIELAEKIDPYELPFLGVLPLRDAPGIVVRYVYPDSPAAKAGLQPGDAITRLNGNPVADAAALRDAIAGLEIGAKAVLQIDRAGANQPLEVKLGTVPTTIPEELPAARGAAPADAPKPPTGVVEVAIPEVANKCIAYVPETYHADVPHGLVVWLHEPDGFDQQKLVDRWQKHCEESSLILLAPQSADPSKWTPQELEFVQKTIDDVIARYNIDRTRLVVHGFKAGGAMAYLTAFNQRALVRGVAVVDAPIPARAQIPAHDPIERLAVYSAAADKSQVAAAIKAGLKRLGDMKFPVTEKSLGDVSRYLNDDELGELVRWIDTLDRI
jgi:serine protease Do